MNQSKDDESLRSRHSMPWVIQELDLLNMDSNEFKKLVDDLDSHHLLFLCKDLVQQAWDAWSAYPVDTSFDEDHLLKLSRRHEVFKETAVFLRRHLARENRRQQEEAL